MAGLAARNMSRIVVVRALQWMCEGVQTGLLITSLVFGNREVGVGERRDLYGSFSSDKKMLLLIVWFVK